MTFRIELRVVDEALKDMLMTVVQAEGVALISVMQEPEPRLTAPQRFAGNSSNVVRDILAQLPDGPFTSKSITPLAQARGITAGALTQRLITLTREGKLKRLKPGVYVRVKN